MGTRRRYSAGIYTVQNNSTTGAIVRKRNKGIRENNRTTIMGQWENRLGINKEQWGDSNGDAKCVRGPMGEFTRMVRYRKGAEIVGTIDKGLGPRVQKHGLECRHVMRAG